MAMKVVLAPSTGVVFTFSVQIDQTMGFFSWQSKPLSSSPKEQKASWKMLLQPLLGGQQVQLSKPIYSCACSMNRDFSVQQKMMGGRKAGPILVPNTRRLILLRHAKSSWANRSLRDHERPLSKRGRRAAASIAAKLRQKGWIPEIMLCSDSMRTRETLGIMQQHFSEFLEAEVHFLGSYYAVAAMDGETTKHLQETVCKFSKDGTNTIMCMGHNRGWEEAASSLSGTPIELKTANAAVLEAYGTSWKETFTSAGIGGWKLLGVVKPDQSSEPFEALDTEYWI